MIDALTTRGTSVAIHDKVEIATSDGMPASRARQVAPMGPRPVSKSEANSRLAVRALNNAAVQRTLAQRGGKNAAVYLAEAERIESVAAALMKPAGSPKVSSGEVAFVPGESGPSSMIADTLADPDMAAVEASYARTELLLTANKDLAAMAIDASASAKASNSFEKMLAHQLALLHTLFMKTGARALEFERRLETSMKGFKEVDSVELSRLSQATSRLSSAFQGGLLTLQRLRNGSDQTLTVRYVTVAAGGQAIIGNVKAGARHARKPGRGAGNDP